MSQPNLIFKKKKKDSPQVETPDSLGNCAELVGLPELVELVVPVPVVADWLVVVNVLPLPLATDDVDVDVETVDDAPCDHTIDVKSGRMKSKGMGGCKKFIVLFW